MGRKDLRPKLGLRRFGLEEKLGKVRIGKINLRLNWDWVWMERINLGHKLGY